MAVIFLGGAVMFDSIKKFITEFSDDGEAAGRFGEDDYRLAATALAIHAAAIDGTVSDAEREKVRAVIKRKFKLDDAATDTLIAEATQVEQQAIDLYQFTARLNRALDDKGRARIIEMMWEIVYADGHVSEFEDNLIWRAADLLHVPRRERIALRQRVAQRGSDRNR